MITQPPEIDRPKIARGPSWVDLLRLLPALRRDFLGTACRCLDGYGDVVKLPNRFPLFILKHPDDIRHVLVANPGNYHKTGALKVGHRLFGQGLLSSEDPLHQKQRRVMQPMFHRERIAGFVGVMNDAAERMLEEWRDGEVVDVAQEMARVTLSIIGKVLFSVDLTREADELQRLFTLAQRHIERQIHSPITSNSRWWPGHRRYDRAMQRFDELVMQLLEEARRSRGERSDLLSLMLDARDEDGRPMSDRQIRDEVVTMLLAGHETVANALTWTWYLVGRHPGVESRLHQEFESVLHGSRPEAADFADLEYCRRVVAEVLRMYPTAWHIGRKALGPDALPSGHLIPGRADVLVYIYALHRDPRFYPEPERFDPDRHTADRSQERPRYAYLPFGAGPRTCIGDGFAKMEAVMLMAHIAQRFKLRVVPDQRVALEPLITLRSKYGMRVRLERR